MGPEAWAPLPAVRLCPLFRGMDEHSIAQALRLLSAREASYQRGAQLKRVYALLPAFGLVLEGAVQAMMDDFDGHPMLMSHVSAGATFGEALWYLRREEPIYLVAAPACRVLWLGSDLLRGRSEDALSRELTDRFTALLAERMLAMNDRIQILSKHTLRLKLTAFLSQWEKRRGCAFEVPMNRARMAAYLGADRSALSRELSRMRDEGILLCDRSRFTLLDHAGAARAPRERTPMIETDRLVLRRVAEQDWRAIQSIWADAARSPYARYDRPNDLGDDAVRHRIAMWASWADSDEHQFYAVCLRGKVIGYIALHRQAEGHELGYCFHSAYHGKGYARESLSALLAFAARRGVRRVEAGTALANTPSVRLLGALGFALTGTEQVSFYRDDRGQPVYFEGGRFELALSPQPHGEGKRRSGA